MKDIEQFAARECCPCGDDLRAYRGDEAAFWRAQHAVARLDLHREREHNEYLRSLVRVLLEERREPHYRPCSHA